MTDKKAPNYTEAQAEHLATEYALGQNDEERKQILENLSVETGRDVRSIRAKLVRMKVYIAKTYVPKTGGAVETKDKIVSSIAATMGVGEDQLAGLNKATKPTLNLLRAVIEIAAADEAETEGEVEAS
jgi:hypothetical protein